MESKEEVSKDLTITSESTKPEEEESKEEAKPESGVFDRSEYAKKNFWDDRFEK